MRISLVLTAVAAVCALAGGACGGGDARPGEDATAAAASDATQPVVEGDTLDVPEEGTPAERLEVLWSRTKPIIERDAQSGYDDAEYMRRREPIWSAWISLQIDASGEDDRASEIIPKVLALINQAYGWTAYSPEERTKRRSNKGRTARLIEEIDQEVGKL